MPKTIQAADLFCGAGGASTGLLLAAEQLGIPVKLLAVNHWPTAVQTHSLNHPGVRHLCESIERVNPRDVVPGGRLHLLLAGPECTHHSTARGGRPINDQSRASAWHILKWAQELYIDNILIENVPEFRTWGPLGANQRPMKSKRGQTYRAFIAALESLGYRVEDRILNAADYGDPTTRQRLFILAQRGQKRVLFPQATHSRTGSPGLFAKTKKWRAAREVIDWTVPGRSIFDRKKPLAPATMERILAGLEKFGGPDLKPFIVLLRKNQTAASVDSPLSTIATSGAHHALCEPFLVAMEHGGRLLDVDNPLPTITTAKGGAFAVAQPFVVPVNHGADSGHLPRSVDQPLPTLTAKANQYLIEPFIISAGGAPLRNPRGTSEPLPTVMGSDRLAIVEPFVLGQQSGSVPRDVGQPLPTLAADGAIALVESFIVDAAHGSDGKSGSPASRTRSVDDPLGTVTGSNRYAIAEPFLVPFYTERPNEQHARVHSVDEPFRTITASGSGKVGVVEPFLVPMYGEREGQEPRTHSVDEPVPTIPASGGGKFGVVEPVIVQTNERRDERVSSVDDPLKTITAAGGRCIGLAEPFITKYNGTAKDRAYSVDDPLDTVSTKDRFGLVQPCIDGYVLDIRFRMLKPHELAGAMSFPKTYVFTGTQGDVVKQIGNSWPGQTARALCTEILTPYVARKRGGRKARVA